MTKKKSKPVEPINETPREIAPKSHISGPEIYSQRDPRWADQHYGLPAADGTSTIGAYGCGITAIAQKLALLGFPTTPLEVQAELLRVNGFRRGGSNNFVDWSRVPMAYPQLHYNGRGDYPNTPVPLSVMEMIYGRLLRNEPVVLYVDAQRYERGLQQHFVLAISTLKSGDLVIANPWNGQTQDLRPYGATDRIAMCGVILLDLKFDARKAI